MSLKKVLLLESSRIRSGSSTTDDIIDYSVV